MLKISIQWEPATLSTDLPGSRFCGGGGDDADSVGGSGNQREAEVLPKSAKRHQGWKSSFYDQKEKRFNLSLSLSQIVSMPLKSGHAHDVWIIKNVTTPDWYENLFLIKIPEGFFFVFIESVCIFLDLLKLVNYIYIRFRFTPLSQTKTEYIPT